MANVIITDAAMRAIRSAVAERTGFRQTGIRTGPDEWHVPLEDETVERIKATALDGESLSDTIIRVVALASNGGRKQ